MWEQDKYREYAWRNRETGYSFHFILFSQDEFEITIFVEGENVGSFKSFPYGGGYFEKIMVDGVALGKVICDHLYEKNKKL